MSTLNVPRTPVLKAALAGMLVIAASPAMADPPARFETADIDDSGTLNIDEFRSTLSKNAPAKQTQNKFKRADRNDDGEISLSEWSKYRKLAKRQKDLRDKRSSQFERADSDEDGFLSYDEFIPTVPGKRPLIEVRRRFLMVDADEDNLVSLGEWLAYRSGRLVEDPKKQGKFVLADLDGDDLLSLEEFATLFPQRAPMKPILRRFDKLDKDGDEFVSRAEWARKAPKIRTEEA